MLTPSNRQIVTRSKSRGARAERTFHRESFFYLRVQVLKSVFYTVRPTLMGAFGILFCNDFKRLFYFFFHTAVRFAPVHHDEKEKEKNSFEIVAKLNSKRSHKSWP